MRYKLLAALVFICSTIRAQQINPVPDYVFANRMSVGRNAVTDTLAYFSIGPRYGAIRGFMPPMVVDTALVTGGTKRNGLTIFSIQKNKYLYWDSVRVQWSDFAGSSGAYIFATDTSSMLSPYIRAAGNGLTKSGQSLLVDTASIATRLRVKKQIDSIAAIELNISDTATMLSPYTRGSGTTNYVPKFTGTRTFGSSQIYDNGTNVGIGTASPTYKLDVNGTTQSVKFLTPSAADGGEYKLGYGGNTSSRSYRIISDAYNFGDFSIQQSTTQTGTSYADKIFISQVGEVYINSNVTTDAGAYALQVVGSIYSTTGAVLAASSGNVTLLNSGSGQKVDINGNLFINSGGYIEISNGDIYFKSNAGYGILSANGNRLVAFTNGLMSVSGDINNTTTIKTGAPTSGSAKPWRLGEAATVSPTSPNRTIRVEIDGTVYYIHAKTTND